jgi:hypothetical protein
LLYATFTADPVQPYAEVVVMWAATGTALQQRDSGWALLCEWCREKGATRVLMSVTRAPRIFTERFHVPLGFRPVAVVWEAPVWR